MRRRASRIPGAVLWLWQSHSRSFLPLAQQRRETSNLFRDWPLPVRCAADSRQQPACGKAYARTGRLSIHCMHPAAPSPFPCREWRRGRHRCRRPHCPVCWASRLHLVIAHVDHIVSRLSQPISQRGRQAAFYQEPHLCTTRTMGALRNNRGPHLGGLRTNSCLSYGWRPGKAICHVT